MLGGEGEGLSWDLQKQSNFIVGVEGHHVPRVGLDSLNVSVATGLLCEAFLRRPVPSRVHKVISDTEDAEGRQRLF